MEGVLKSVLNALTAMKTSQAFVRSISTNTDVLRVHWQGLGVVTQAWNPQSWAGATGHKPQINRGGWATHTNCNSHFWLRLLRDPPSLQSSDFPQSILTFLLCAVLQSGLITFATANITVTHSQEPARGSLSRSRANYFCLHRGLASKCQVEQVDNLLKRFFLITQNKPGCQRSPAELCHVWGCALQSGTCCARYESS